MGTDWKDDMQDIIELCWIKGFHRENPYSSRTFTFLLYCCEEDFRDFLE